MRFLFGSLFLTIGIIGMFRPLWIVGVLGRNPWAEAHLGAEGGSRIFYRLLGILFFIVSLMFMLFKFPF